MKIGAVIVTYNRKELLLQNIKACLAQSKQLSVIIIVDNHGTDGTYDYIKSNLKDSEFSLIDYRYLEKNIGGSGGFHVGTKFAYELGCDLIWLMDDDGRPKNAKTLEELITFILQNGYENSPFIVNSLVCCDDLNLSFGLIENGIIKYRIEELEKDVIEGFINPFNGTMISKYLIDKIGYPRGDYFIKGDEVEYFRRCKSNNVPIFTISTSLYYHPSPNSNLKKKRFFKKEILNNIEAGWKEFYSMRNSCLNSKQYDRHSFIKNVRRYMIRVIKILLMGKHKFKLIHMVTKGFFHGIFGKSGIYYLPGDKKVK